jgi:hypothetical protein
LSIEEISGRIATYAIKEHTEGTLRVWR